MNGVQTRFKCKLDVKRCKRFVFPPSSLLPRSNALKTKAIRYFQTDRTLTRIVSPPLYKHPIHQELEETAKKIGGHGGMDFIMDYRLVYCLRNGLPLDMDVYDLAEWCCMADLTRLSIENGNAPVAVPDFTRGNWNKVDGYHHAFAQ